MTLPSWDHRGAHLAAISLSPTCTRISANIDDQVLPSIGDQALTSFDGGDFVSRRRAVPVSHGLVLRRGWFELLPMSGCAPLRSTRRCRREGQCFRASIRRCL
jgi:hypothetical protein